MILAAHYAEGMGLPALAEGIAGSLDFLASNAREARSDQRDFHAILHDTVAGLSDQDKTVLRNSRSSSVALMRRPPWRSRMHRCSSSCRCEKMRSSCRTRATTTCCWRPYAATNLLERHSAEAEETRSRYVRYCAGRIERALYTGDWASMPMHSKPTPKNSSSPGNGRP